MKYLRRVSQRVLVLTLEQTAQWQFLRFAISGASCVFLEMAMLISMVELFGESGVLFFNSIAFSSAVVVNYLLSRYWVFEPGRFDVQTEFIAFVSLAFVGLGLNYLIMWLAIERMEMHYIMAKMMAIVIVIAWNYTTKKFFIFKG